MFAGGHFGFTFFKTLHFKKLFFSLGRIFLCLVAYSFDIWQVGL